MKVEHSLAEWRKLRSGLKGRLGFIPTMGALHDGHLSLVEKSRSENDLTLVSIFVNPTQFDDRKDLQNYPRDIDYDLERLENHGVDYVLLPAEGELYPDGYRFRVTENEKSRVLCGAFRTGHFDGVLSVVLKLLNLAQANRAYFGEKDFQQLVLVREMVEAFFIPTEIVACPVVRNESGLALSSRNEKLSPELRKQAASFAEILKKHQPVQMTRDELEEVGFEVDYVEDHWNRRLGAVRLGGVRLIDNVPANSL